MLRAIVLDRGAEFRAEALVAMVELGHAKKGGLAREWILFTGEKYPSSQKKRVHNPAVSQMQTRQNGAYGS
jgi:hypothetical protein